MFSVLVWWKNIPAISKPNANCFVMNRDLGELDGNILVFGGPYSNLAVTRAMRQKAAELDIPSSRIICTGDVVAYCGEPRETAELIMEWGIPLLMGNCEESLGFEEDDCGCGFEQDSSCSILSISWYQFANQLMTTELRNWMKALPRLISFGYQGQRFVVIHGSVSSINQFIFPSTPWPEKFDQINSAGADIVIGGHCGIPFGQYQGNNGWLNSGVIGMPANDGSADGWYMLLEPTTHGFRASWHRLSYDVVPSQQSTHDAGMFEYARALGDGLWPGMDILPEAERNLRGEKLTLAPLLFRAD